MYQNGLSDKVQAYENLYQNSKMKKGQTINSVKVSKSYGHLPTSKGDSQTQVN